MGGVKLTKFLKYTYNWIAAVIGSAAAYVHTRFQSRRDDILLTGGGCAAGTQPPAGSVVAYAPLSAGVFVVSTVVFVVSALVVGISALVDGSPAPVGGLSALVLGSPAPVVGSSAIVEKSSAFVSVISTPNEKVLTESKQMLKINQYYIK